MCTIKVGLSVDDKGNWNESVEVLPVAIDGLERIIESYSPDPPNEDDHPTKKLVITDALKLSTFGIDNMVAVIETNDLCTIIPVHGLIDGWIHDRGNTATLNGKEIDLYRFRIQIISSFSWPRNICVSVNDDVTISDRESIRTETMAVSVAKKSQKSIHRKKHNGRTMTWIS